jgi:hypothetical protein
MVQLTILSVITTLVQTALQTILSATTILVRTGQAITRNAIMFAQMVTLTILLVALQLVQTELQTFHTATMYVPTDTLTTQPVVLLHVEMDATTIQVATHAHQA